MLAEAITILGLIGIGVASIILSPDQSREVIISVVSGLLGYLTRGEKK